MRKWAKGPPTFTDVSSDKWYYTWVTKAAQQGWVSGVGDGRFDPEGSVTFAQFAKSISIYRHAMTHHKL